MKKSITLFLGLAFSFFIQAQTTHDVTVQSNSFTPSNLTIDVGDEVTWTNIGGNHNVNGTNSTYPDNPESFGNSVGSGWTFSHTFTIPGTYDYQCDPHVGFNMIGQITVVDIASGLDEVELAVFTLFPNPNNGQFTIVNDGENGTYLIEMMDVTGKFVYSEQMQLNANEQTEINTDNVTTGVYLLKVTNTEENYFRTIRMVVK